QALQAEGGAVLASTHDAVLAAALGDQVRLPDPPGPTAGLAPAAYAVTEVLDPDGPPSARANPLALLLVALAAALGSFAITDWRVGLAGLALVALAAPLAVRSARSLLPRLVPVGLAALTVGWSALVFSDRAAFSPDAWPVAAREVLRIGYLVVPGVLVVPSLPPSRLGDALAQRAHLPHRPVVAAAAALLRLQHLLDTWRQMVEIRTIRALSPGRSIPARVRHAASLTFALLVWTLRASQEMALSMDARGFAAASRRTFALGSPWRRVDWICTGLAAVLGLTPLVLTRLLA
ncbi:MAG: transporter ATPase, partial [Friedmanniella sp.]|nr:transporter ATPase [Friedmanniella sp.]